MNNMHLLLMTSGILYKHAAKNVENGDCKSIAVGFLLILIKTRNWNKIALVDTEQN